MYQCSKCNKTFNEVAWVSYTEYAGGCPQQEPVSPCCRSRYDDVEEMEAKERDEAAIVAGEHRYRQSVLGDEA